VVLGIGTVLMRGGLGMGCKGSLIGRVREEFVGDFKNELFVDN
jgi:hypothetical protein